MKTKTVKKAAKTAKTSMKKLAKRGLGPKAYLRPATEVEALLFAKLRTAQANLRDARAEITLLSDRLAAAQAKLACAERERDEACRTAEAAVREKVDSEAKLHALVDEAPAAPPRAHAYLMAHLDLATMKVDDACLMSEDTPSCHLGRERWLVARTYTAGSYGEAYEQAVKAIRPNGRSPLDDWCRDWIIKHDDAMPKTDDTVTAVAPTAPPPAPPAPPAPRERNIGRVIDAAIKLMGEGFCLTAAAVIAREQLVDRLRQIQRDAGFMAPEVAYEGWGALVEALADAVDEGVIPAPTPDAPVWARQLSDLIEGRLDAETVLAHHHHFEVGADGKGRCACGQLTFAAQVLAPKAPEAPEGDR